MKKLLTIVIPTYNMQDYLSRGLNSLIVPDSELMKQLEVLVINDGSTDRSSEIAHEYETKYPLTFRVIDKENGHYGSCVNRGLKEATGKYIKILDADDWFDTANFEKFLHFLAETDVDLVLSDFDIVDEKGAVRETHHYYVNGIQRIHEIPSFDDMWMHAVAYKVSVFNGLDYHQTEGIAYTDQEWIFLPMVHVKNVIGFPHVLYKYVLGREGQTMDPKVCVRSVSNEIKCWESQQYAWEKSETLGRGDAENYLWSRLKGRALHLYSILILNYRKGYDSQLINKLDMFVQEHNPRLYQLTEEFTARDNLRFRYIHYWRKWRNRPLVAFIKKVESAVMRKLFNK